MLNAKLSSGALSFLKVHSRSRAHQKKNGKYEKYRLAAV
jgi:hypothetical protein